LFRIFNGHWLKVELKTYKIFARDHLARAVFFKCVLQIIIWLEVFSGGEDERLMKL
jgi:hypothetical protein